MLKVKDGDLDKLGLLFERYHRRLFGFFYRLTRRQDISEDLVQSVFERILKYRHTYSNSGPFSTWLFQIARNIHTDFYRKKEKHEEEIEKIEWNSIAEESQEPELEDNRKQKLLETALEKLDPIKKETLILSRYQGFKYKEIATIMDCSESAVKVRVFRALNELKEIITELKKRNEI